MKSRITKAVLLSALAFGGLSIAAESTAHAGTWCGPYAITAMGLGSDGTLFGSFSGFGNAEPMCTVNADAGGWTANACRTLQTEMWAAMLAGKRATLVFNAKADCTSPGDWVALSSFGLYYIDFH
ncbi:MAG TPA: hypothetical protein VKP30_18920 [Polyangiaceae bacterium]|nr:hypothetical protein [Polyangiaceae bacterium]